MLRFCNFLKLTNVTFPEHSSFFFQVLSLEKLLKVFISLSNMQNISEDKNNQAKLQKLLSSQLLSTTQCISRWLHSPQQFLLARPVSLLPPNWPFLFTEWASTHFIISSIYDRHKTDSLIRRLLMMLHHFLEAFSSSHAGRNALP